MCGISGIFSVAPDPTLETPLAGMTAALRHRGPDGEGIEILAGGRVGLGHTRLAIVDPSPRGRQPMSSADGRLVLTYNGEIYNYPDLRRELERQGCRFRSDCDAEVILHLYAREGEACVRRLRGMYAFALYDADADVVFCARDPVGKKPLVYAETPHATAVASEIPALFEVPGVDLRVDPEAVALYLLRNLRHVPDPWTLYRGIRRLPPGHAMRLRSGRVESVWRHWRPDFSPRPVTTAELLEAFDEAVSRRLMADVEVGALLSGGVDSTAIVDSMSRRGRTGLRTYAFGGGPEDDELSRARAAAERYATRHCEYHFDPGRQREYLDALLRQHGEPLMALPLTHAYALAQSVRDDGLKVVLSGHGADELFYGYAGHRPMAWLSDLAGMVPGAMRRGLRRGAAAFPPRHPLREALIAAGGEAGRRKADLYADEASTLWPALFGETHARGLAADVIDRWTEPWLRDDPPAAFIDESAFLGLIQENCHAVTLAADVPAMAHGVEVRCPFLDVDLVELALRVPYREKVARGGGDAASKRILKTALASRLPSEVLDAPKKGFGFHVQESDVIRGSWKTQVDSAFEAFDDLDGLIDLAAVRRLKANFDAGRNVPAMLIAKLYALQRTREVVDVGGRRS